VQIRRADFGFETAFLALVSACCEPMKFTSNANQFFSNLLLDGINEEGDEVVNQVSPTFLVL
jgi:hypothetical protein